MIFITIIVGMSLLYYAYDKKKSYDIKEKQIELEQKRVELEMKKLEIDQNKQM